MLSPRQRNIVRVLLTHYRYQPEGPGMTRADITEAVDDNPGAIRQALTTLSAELAASRVPYTLRTEVDQILRLRPLRYRLVPKTYTIERGTADPGPQFKARCEKAFRKHHLAPLPEIA